MVRTHNLDIHMYNLKELLGLFDLDYTINMEDLKRAKKKVLMSHPDKSKLDPKYFLFYKKAFELIVQFYEHQNKDKILSKNGTVYDKHQLNQLDEQSTKNVQSSINELSTNDFQTKFNKLFDENMTKKTDTSKNDWFTNEENSYEIKEQVNNKNMGEIFERIKDNQTSLIKHRGVEALYVNSNSGNKLYDDDENDDEYVTTDPFSKLKFDDLRKVHKDQTVFSVSEKDIHKRPVYTSVDHFQRERGKQNMNPLEKQEAERILSQQNETYTQQMMQKEYDAKLKGMEYEKKNKRVLSNFLRIQN